MNNKPIFKTNKLVPLGETGTNQMRISPTVLTNAQARQQTNQFPKVTTNFQMDKWKSEMPVKSLMDYDAGLNSEKSQIIDNAKKKIKAKAAGKIQESNLSEDRKRKELQDSMREAEELAENAKKGNSKALLMISHMVAGTGDAIAGKDTARTDAYFDRKYQEADLNDPMSAKNRQFRQQLKELGYERIVPIKENLTIPMAEKYLKPMMTDYYNRIQPKAGGGAAAKKDLRTTQAERTGLSYYEQMKQANKALEEDFSDYIPSYIDRGLFGIRGTQDEKYKDMMAVAMQFADAKLRLETGAQAPESEIRRIVTERYIPVPGDTKNVIERKKKNRKKDLQNVKVIAGNAYIKRYGEDPFKNFNNTDNDEDTISKDPLNIGL